MRFVDLLHDGHGHVYPPEALQDAFYARPPLRSGFVEGRGPVSTCAATAAARRTMATTS